MDPPQEVVRVLFGRRLLEALHFDALRVHGADHVPAGAVLAGPVDALQHDQQRAAAVAVEQALHGCQLGVGALELLLGGLLRIHGVP